MKDIENFLTQNSFLPTTQVGYRYVLRNLDQYLERNRIDITDATAETIAKWLDSNPAWGENQRYKGYAASRSYIRWRFGHLHPTMLFKLRRPSPIPQRTLNRNQVDRLLNSIDLDTPVGVRDYAVVSLMLDTGLRKTEVCRLQFEHVDLEARTFTVQIKGGDWGAGYFSEYTKNTLLDWLDLRRFLARPKTKTFFTSVGGGTPGANLSPEGLGCIFKAISKRCGFVVSAHDLRRTFAVLLTLRGAPTELVRRAGRWKNLETVKIYTQQLQDKAIEPYLPMNYLGSKAEE